MKLNKTLLLSLLSVSLFTVTHAQIQFGIKGGPSFTTFTGSDAGGAKLIVGFHAGGIIKIPFNDQFSLQPEVLYSAQGAKATTTDAYGNVQDFTAHVNYLNVPFMLTFTHSSGLILQTGPQIGFLLSASAPGVPDAEYKKGYKSADFGWTSGIGYLSPANIGFLFRYSAGWLNIENTSYTQGTGSIHNIGLQLSVFYLFGGSDNDRY